MDDDATDTRINQTIETLLYLAVRRERARRGGHRSEALDADEQLLLKIADAVDKHLAKAPLATTEGGRHVTLADARLAQARDFLRTILDGVNEELWDADHAVDVIERLFTKFGNPPRNGAVLALVAPGKHESATFQMRAWIREERGPAQAATTLVERFGDRSSNTVDAYAALSKKRGVPLAIEARGDQPSAYEVSLFALGCLGVSPHDLNVDLHGSPAGYAEYGYGVPPGEVVDDRATPLFDPPPMDPDSSTKS